MPDHLSRGTDHIGFISAKLRDLQGFATLACELIQNADDVHSATSIIFNIRDEALIVDNDGSFTDCGCIEEGDCPWRKARGYRCDFHRFRFVAGGDKREQGETTGAFGIGFIAVYQVTDHPEVISSGRHWKLNEEAPEDKRIEVCQGCQNCRTEGLPSTRFILPWARESSTLRQKLRVESVSEEKISRFEEELKSFLPNTLLFLRRIERIDLRRNGAQVAYRERLKDGDSLILTDGNPNDDQLWYFIPGNFKDRAAVLKDKHLGRIEKDRKSEVSLAVPKEMLTSGRLYAFLPTQHETGLPFHINADFFPNSDRKHIIFEAEYQSEWNRAAISAAAKSLCSSLSTNGLRQLVGHNGLWNLIKAVKDVAEKSERGTIEKSFGSFWNECKSILRDLPLIYTTMQEWRRPDESIYLQSPDEALAIPLLEELGFSVINEELRQYQIC